jgi:hypothetical protein
MRAISYSICSTTTRRTSSPTRHSTDTHGAQPGQFFCAYMPAGTALPRAIRPCRRKPPPSSDSTCQVSIRPDMLIRPSNKVDEDLIISEWPNVQRILASLAQKDTTQATVVRKLSSYARQKQHQKGPCGSWTTSFAPSTYWTSLTMSSLRQSVQKALKPGRGLSPVSAGRVSFINGGKFKVQTENRAAKSGTIAPG